MRQNNNLAIQQKAIYLKSLLTNIVSLNSKHAVDNSQLFVTN